MNDSPEISEQMHHLVCIYVFQLCKEKLRVTYALEVCLTTHWIVGIHVSFKLLNTLLHMWFTNSMQNRVLKIISVIKVILKSKFISGIHALSNPFCAVLFVLYWDTCFFSTEPLFHWTPHQVTTQPSGKRCSTCLRSWGAAVSIALLSTARVLHGSYLLFFGGRGSFMKSSVEIVIDRLFIKV